MALKDWTKYSSTKWIKHNTSTTLEIIPNILKKYSVVLHNRNERLLLNTNLTSLEGIKFAKEYMKKH